jgi:hypothetical protein
MEWQNSTQGDPLVASSQAPYCPLQWVGPVIVKFESCYNRDRGRQSFEARSVRDAEPQCLSDSWAVVAEPLGGVKRDAELTIAAVVHSP